MEHGQFNKGEVEILREVAVEVEEFHYEMRKGVSQNKYVFEVKPGATWNDWENMKLDIPVPEALIGLWVMSYATDLVYDNLNKSIEEYQWAKCVKEETISYEYVEIKP